MTAQPPLLDLNADLGEGFGDWSMGDDEAMLDVVTTANIAGSSRFVVMGSVASLT